ncbi:MAG: hypothetical protein FD123_3658 [Bacteroidetes bacterium]|nr:MAG: hypothetical protein FD123_3658 [Bacteroidota bacterium]
MNKPEQIDESKLDLFLNGFFLEENAAEADMLAAGFVFGQQYAVTIDAKKERNLLDRLAGKNKGGSGWKLFLSLLLAVGLTTGGIWFFGKDGNEKQETAATALKENDRIMSPGDSADTPPSSFETGKAVPASVRTTALPPGFPENPLPPFPAPLAPFSGGSAGPASNPLFSEEEFERYARLKNNLLEKISGIDENLYTRIEEGKVKYSGKSLPVDAFVIRNYAVTNLEYRIFLADLVKNGRMDDYNLAAMHAENWNDYNCAKLAEAYGSDNRYSDFPAVNISREGVALYCSWLEKQLNDFLKARNPKARQLKVRLPYDYEWIYAAKTGYAEVPDCSGYNTIYDPKNGLVDKTFLKRLVKVKTVDRSQATAMDALFAVNRYKMSEEDVLRIFEQGLRYSAPAGDSIGVKRIANLNKAGHVSEIIQDPAGKTVIMGSCWKSREEYQEMLGEFQKRGGSPYVGFRVVIMHADKGSYKNPFW